MKGWKRDLGLVRELGPDTRRFDAAVQRVWSYLEEVEKALEELVDDRRELGLRYEDLLIRAEERLIENGELETKLARLHAELTSARQSDDAA